MLNIKVDRDLKIKAKKVVGDLGLNFSIVLNNYLKTLIQERRVSFYADEIPNKKTAEILDKALFDHKTREDTKGPYKDVDEFIKNLQK